MGVIQEVVKTKSDNEFYSKHLSIINNLLPIRLTEKEIKVLAAFLSSDKVLIDEYMFNTLVRKKVMKELKISAGGLGNYLKSMVDKGFISKNPITKKLTVKPYLIPKGNVQGYTIKLERNGTN